MGEIKIWLIYYIHISLLFIAAFIGISAPFLFMKWITDFSSWREYRRACKRTSEEHFARVMFTKEELQ